MNELDDFSFSDETKPEQNSKLCTGMIICAIVILIIVLTTRMCGRSRSYRPSMYASGRASHMGGVDCHAKTDFTNSGVYNLTHCSETDASCKDVKNVNKEVAVENGNKLVEFDKTHENCMYMVYAPWCPHCHKAMPNFVEASKASKTPFALVNAELLPPALIQGENAIVDVKHFPFFCHKNGTTKDVLKVAPTTENIVKFANETPRETPKKAPDQLDLMFA